MSDESVVTGDRQASVRSASGFTLIEVLVATVIMIVGVFGLMAVFPTAYRTTKDSGRVSVLHHLASERLDQLRSLDFDHSSLGMGVHPAVQADSTGTFYYPLTGFDEEYSLRWIVLPGPTDATGNPVARMKTVVVEATHDVRYSTSGDPLPSVSGSTTTLRTFLTDL